MSYAIRAFIGKVATIQPLASRLPTAHIVALPHSFALIPLTDALAELFELDGFAEPFWLLPKLLLAFATEFSSAGLLGYFEIDMFGSIGSRSAILWHNQEVILGPLTSENTVATERLFELLGVPTTQLHDRFTTLGLGRHRHLNDWLDE
jgi:hypothetical protein